MARSPLTYAGALALLGKHNHPVLEKLDKLLGGAILVGGAATHGVAWALLEPKNELVAISETLLSSAKNRILRTSGYERRELLAAAHTVLAISAFFNGVAHVLGPGYQLLELTTDEKIRLAGGTLAGGRRFIDNVLSTQIELPAIDYSLIGVDRFGAMSHATVDFIKGLAVADQVLGNGDSFWLAKRIADLANQNYQDAYLRFAVEVPEFALWISWTYGRTILDEVRATRSDTVARLTEQSNALHTMYELLALTATGEQPTTRSDRELLAARANAVLTKPLLRFNTRQNTSRLQFPSVEQGFVTPRFRMARYDSASTPANDGWWQLYPERSGLDEFLAAHLVSSDSTRLPLLILGDPGAGKSLLTELLAARLPTAAFTVFRVELRKVSAEKKIYQQISEAMGTALDKDDLQWGDLTEQCDDTVRVVILDGFDELLLATGVAQSAYLEEVAEFQQKELDLQRPVAVIVTTRTLVADRARIAHGSLMIKLEEFDDDQITTWLAAWNAANASTPGFRALEPAEIGNHRDLACQPLLLLILAIYAADPATGRLDAQNLSSARLYQRLLDTFIRREVDKPGERLTPEEFNAQTVRQRWRLSLTAFGMFNRGLQVITEAELESDLAVFGLSATPRERLSFDHQMGEAEQTISSFFFIQDSTAVESKTGRRQTFGFLHSTFAEYLIAERTMQLMIGLAERYATAGDEFPVPEIPDDDRAFALLSHQVLLKRAPIIDSAAAIHRDLNERQRHRMQVLLIELLRRAGTQQGHRKFDQYSPTPHHIVGRLATYTTNLTTLIISLSDDELTPHLLAPEDSDAMRWWQSMVALWESGLDDEGWASVLSNFTLRPGPMPIFQRRPGSRASLMGRFDDDLRMQAGDKLLGNDKLIDNDADIVQYLDFVDLVIGIPGMGPSSRILPQWEESISNFGRWVSSDPRLFRNNMHALWTVLSRHAGQLPYSAVDSLMTLLVPDKVAGAISELAAVVCAHPKLLINNPLLMRFVQKSASWPAFDTPTAIAILWQAERHADGPERDALRQFRRWIDLSARDRTIVIQDRMRVVPEFFTFLRTQEPNEYLGTYGRTLLNSLIAASSNELRHIAPLDALYLVEIFGGGELIRHFVRRYLRANRVSVDGDDEDELLMALRAYAELPWTRP